MRHDSQSTVVVLILYSCRHEYKYAEAYTPRPRGAVVGAVGILPHVMGTGLDAAGLQSMD